MQRCDVCLWSVGRCCGALRRRHRTDRASVGSGGVDPKDTSPEVSCPPGLETLSLSVILNTAGIGSDTALLHMDLT